MATAPPLVQPTLCCLPRALRTKLRKEGKVPGSDEGGSPSGFFTSATGVTVYRGDAFPPEYRGDRPAEDDQTVIVLHHNAGHPHRLSLGETLSLCAKVLGLRRV